MGIIVKIPKNTKYVLPNMCAACGKEGAARIPIFRYEVQFGSHTSFIFYVCNECARYAGGPAGGKMPRGVEFNLLPTEEKKRALNANFCVGVKLPFFYLGKMQFSFINDNYGINFWELNGGEMSEFNSNWKEDI